ncbi:leucyl aminopeptidase [Gordonia sp. (in: high G+C Gram-positive bacteria)]|uniref:leucyl aminopeptidase n=1 Tax=Gordonia sp. (in: high G+C Gram-positive bacteria) TaxID=84139 RepID=UPI0026333930|nr:leucyl aminopeptidase [Gordonia sp. (in: high G+C Gram-positive bacteria)]
MSSNDILNRARGPRIDLATGLTKNDDVLVIGLLTGDTDDDAKTSPTDPDPVLLLTDDLLDDEAAEALTAALRAVRASGKTGQVVTVPAPAALPVRLVVAVGLGAAEDAEDAETVRQAAGDAIRTLDGAGPVVSTLSAAGLGAAAEGFYLGAYRFDEFRSAASRSPKEPAGEISLLVPQKTKQARAELDHALVVADAVALARDFVNTPPSHLYPGEFADRARRAGGAAGLTVEILDEEALAAGGYGGIVGVGQGSSRPPRLVRLAYTPSAKNDARKKVALVGKGVTFDTGGISIKPAAGMDHMTSDMGGAAAVIATVIAAARLGLDVAVTATVPMAENMPSGTAQRPGDVLTQYGGTTVEVLNTDAEGRLILADAIVRACEDDPDYLIDTATLTGAQMVALGTRTPGVFGTDEFRDRVAAISRAVGENGWAMPLPAELRSDLNSRVADLANVTNHRWGGMLSAAIFLREFVSDGVGWAHLDVAGPAFNTGGPWGYTPKGGTGVPVRTLIAVLEDIAEAG